MSSRKSLSGEDVTDQVRGILRLQPGDILRQAADLIDGNRATTHGDMAITQRNIAALWSAYLGREVTAIQVAMMMALLKIARTKTGAANEDDPRDAAGYLAIYQELRTREAD